MARIFLVSYGGGHVASLVPVARALAQRGHELVFLGLTTARTALAAAGIPSIGFPDLWRFAAPGAREAGAELSASLSTAAAIPREESEAYLGISFAELVQQHGPEKARLSYAEHGRHAFLPVAFFERVLADARPDVVVATNSPRSEQAALLAAGRLGIASICVVDLFALQEVRWVGQPGYATRVCVLNEHVRRLFLDHGRTPDEVVVTGNPAFDRLREADVARAGFDLRQDRGWDDGRVNVLWASQAEPAKHPFNGRSGDPTLPRRVERQLRDLVADEPRLRLVVRYHPNELERFEPQPYVEQSLPGEPLAPLLHAVDVVVVTASTVGFEAAMAGRPVLSVDCSVFTADAPYASMGISIGVGSVEELPAVLRRRIASPIVRPMLGARGPEGSAASRVVHVIESLFSIGV